MHFSRFSVTLQATCTCWLTFIEDFPEVLREKTNHESMQRSSIYTYVLLSLAFIVVNVFTLGNLAPWIDEVMMLDTSYNMAVHGTWETTAWYRVVGQYPFSTYPPLYQMVATAWIWLFGGSLVAVRSLNLIITFVLGGMCLRLMKRHGVRLTAWTVALFTLLLWGTSEMAWMYRNGRPDMLCALMLVVTVFAVDAYLSAKSPASRLAVVLSSALLLCSGIQAAVCLLVLWLFFFIAAQGQRRACLRLLGLLLSGVLLGVVMVALFMAAHGRLVAFASSIVQYSATLSGIALAVLPWAGEVFGFSAAPYMQKLLELSTESSLSERLAFIAEYRSFLLLSVTAIAAYAWCFRRNLKALMGDRGFLMLLCALYVPFVMTLAGRFVAYYRWMAFLPLLVAIMSIAVRSRLWCSVFSVVAVVLTAFGIRSMSPDRQWDYGNMRSFVERQHFRSSDAVVCPFSVFYEMKPVCDTCYFVGIFPTEYLGRVDYIIEPRGSSDGFDRPITDYVDRLKTDSTVVLTAIDHCEHPSLTLYQVRKKHE